MIDIDVTPTGSNPGLTLRRSRERLRHERGAAQQHDRQRDLRENEAASRDVASARARESASAFTKQRDVQHCPANRQQSKHDPERERRADAELDAAPVERYFIEARQRLRCDRQHDVQQCPCDRDRAARRQ